jgi:soluble lytic murein transglycosylase-like protein
MGYTDAPIGLHDPSTSINLGANYLSRMYNYTGDWNQDWDNALNRYNGGADPAYAQRVGAQEGSYLPQ